MSSRGPWLRNCSRTGPESLRAEFENLLQEVAPDEVILDIANLDALAVVLNVCNERRIPWHFVPSLDQLVFGNSRTHLIAGIPLVSIKQVNLSGFNLLVKRLIDVSVAAFMMLLRRRLWQPSGLPSSLPPLARQSLCNEELAGKEICSIYISSEP